MLPKKERLTTEDISLLQNGKSVFGEKLSIRYVSSPILKFSVSVSKKIGKTAVIRNRIRRRVYSALRGIKKDLSKKAFVMVMPKKECLDLSLSEIGSEASALLKKAGL